MVGFRMYKWRGLRVQKSKELIVSTDKYAWPWPQTLGIGYHRRTIRRLYGAFQGYIWRVGI